MSNYLTKSIFSLFLICFTTFTVPAHAEELDQIAAVINDAVITQTELHNAMNLIKKQMTQAQSAIPTEKVLRKQVLDQMINRKLQLQMAEQAGVSVTSPEIENAVKTIAKNNKLTTEQLYAKLTESGMNKKDYHKELHDEILIQKLQQQELSGKVKVTPEEVDNYMHSKAWQVYNNKEYHLEEIVVALPSEPTTDQINEAKQRSADILKKIQSGTSFNEAAMSESSTDNALQGGDLGWRSLPEIPGPVAEKITHTSVNGVIGPLQTPNAFVLVHLADVRTVKNKQSIAEQRVQVQQLLTQRKSEEALQNWMAKLKGSAFIEITGENKLT